MEKIAQGKDKARGGVGRNVRIRAGREDGRRRGEREVEGI